MTTGAVNRSRLGRCGMYMPRLAAVERSPLAVGSACRRRWPCSIVPRRAHRSRHSADVVVPVARPKLRLIASHLSHRSGSQNSSSNAFNEKRPHGSGRRRTLPGPGRSQSRKSSASSHAPGQRARLFSATVRAGGNQLNSLCHSALHGISKDGATLPAVAAKARRRATSESCGEHVRRSPAGTWSRSR